MKRSEFLESEMERPYRRKFIEVAMNLRRFKIKLIKISKFWRKIKREHLVSIENFKFGRSEK